MERKIIELGIHGIHGIGTYRVGGKEYFSQKTIAAIRPIESGKGYELIDDAGKQIAFWQNEKFSVIYDKDKYDYPLAICKYCACTEYGDEPLHQGYPNTSCEGGGCELAADAYEDETGKKWVD